MNGRVYDPRLGRFLSADPMVQQEYNLQNLNRYSYVLNNPLNATDPSGYFWAELFSMAAEYFASESFTQSLAMMAVSFASNGGIQFTYSSADAFSYGQGAQRSLESQAFDSYDLGGRSNGLARAKAQANLSPGTVSSGVTGANEDEDDKDPSSHPLWVSDEQLEMASSGDLRGYYKSLVAQGHGNVAFVGLGIWGTWEDNVEAHGYLDLAAYWSKFVGPLTVLNSYAAMSDGLAYLPFADGANVKIMNAHIHSKQLAIRVAVEHGNAVRQDIRDNRGVAGLLSERQITAYHHKAFKEYNGNIKFYGGTLGVGNTQNVAADAWKFTLRAGYCWPSCDWN